MVKRLPEWLKQKYKMLWDRLGKEAFILDDTISLLNISESMAVKTLWQLENRGFVHKTRNELDYRVKEYRLIPPEDVSFVIGLYSLIEKDEFRKLAIKDKLILIGDKILYAVTGSHAAYQYHHYVNPPGVYELKIRPIDEGKWIAFLTDKYTRVYLNEALETKPVKHYIKLVPTEIDITDIRHRTDSGYYIEKIEPLLIELLLRETQTSIIEAAAMIIQNASDINWLGEKGIVPLAIESNATRRLGFLLDVINYESNLNIVNEEVISVIKDTVKGRSTTFFPNDNVLLSRYNELKEKTTHRSMITDEEYSKHKKALERYEGYLELGERWGLRSILPRDVIKKVLADLGVNTW